MEPLWDAWDRRLRPRVRRAKHFLLFSDYDGTLTPIVATPEQAVLSPDMKVLLGELSSLPRVSLAIISGRALEDIRRLVGIEGIYYAGNHGLEVQGPGLSWTHPRALEIASLIERLSRELEERLRKVPGALVEDKGLTLSVHYRLVPEGEEARVKQILDGVVSPWPDRVKVTGGKKVYEVRPLLDWDKGKAVLKLRELLEREGSLLFYLGDDVTDEDAFKALGDDGIGIFIGPPGVPSHASYFLPTVEEARDFLTRLKEEAVALGG